MANKIRNITPRSQDVLVPTAMFARTNQVQQLDHLHTFRCPVYVLDTRLQQSKKIDKWQQRSRMGVYLGQSKHHTITVHLVLSIKTGLVSPQYHVKFDNYFKTTRWKEYLPKSLWQIKARLAKPPPSSSPDLDPETLTRTLCYTQKGETVKITAILNKKKKYIKERKQKFQMMTFQITTMNNGLT